MRTTILAALMLLSGAAQAQVTYQSESAWLTAVGEVTEYDWSDCLSGAVAENHYAPDVVLGSNDRCEFAPAWYPQDDIGVNGNGTIIITLAQPANAIAVRHPGAMEITIGVPSDYTSNPCGSAGGPGGSFCGIAGVQPFTQILLRDWWDGTARIDDMLIVYGAAPEKTCKPNSTPILGLILQRDPLEVTGIAVPEPGDECLVYEEVAPGSIVEGSYLEYVIGDR